MADVEPLRVASVMTVTPCDFCPDVIAFMRYQCWMCLFVVADWLLTTARNISQKILCAMVKLADFLRNLIITIILH